MAGAGPCTLYKPLSREGGEGVSPPSEGLSAGTISITGTVETITLQESHERGGVKYRPSARVANPPFVHGATIRVEASGGADVRAFTISVVAPPELIGFAPPRSLTRSGYTATWSPDSGTAIEIVIGASSSRTSEDGAILLCRVPDTGTYSVPASTLALFPPSFDEALVNVSRVADTVSILGNARITLEATTLVGSSEPIPFAPLAPDNPTPVP